MSQSAVQKSPAAEAAEKAQEAHAPAKVKGLTIREIRYQRALVTMQKEFCKEKITISLDRVKRSSPFSKDYDGGADNKSRASGIIGKLLSGLNYVDYAMAGYSVYNTGKKFLGIFKRNKK
ncbi:MAG: hypothetical protein HDR80_08750 [Bacteroides sp.]|nr:hypothetical protein [Bacteroides sp.]